jgi:hypothetical protein
MSHNNAEPLFWRYNLAANTLMAGPLVFTFAAICSLALRLELANIVSEVEARRRGMWQPQTLIVDPFFGYQRDDAVVGQNTNYSSVATFEPNFQTFTGTGHRL